MKEMFKRFIELIKLPDNEEKKKAMRVFFDELNRMKIEKFNWADEIFEGIHVKENGSKIALHWIDIENGDEKKFSYEKFAREGNRLVNYLRDFGLDKGSFVHLMTPTIIPETWFSCYAFVKGGFVGVCNAHILIEYRFKVCPPDAIIADENSAKVIDAVEANPKVKIVIGDRSDGNLMMISDRKNQTAKMQIRWRTIPYYASLPLELQDCRKAFCIQPHPTQLDT